MVGPLVPIRGQVALGGSRHAPMMGPLRPFPPRFVAPDMYRLRPPPNPSKFENYTFTMRMKTHHADYLYFAQDSGQCFRGTICDETIF